MKNPFKFFKKEKSFQPIITENQPLFYINQLIDQMFPSANAQQKRSLLQAGQGTVYACVNIISNACSSAVLRLYTEGKPNNKLSSKQIKSLEKYKIKNVDNVVEITDHEAIELLYKPNSIHSMLDLWILTWTHKLLVGDAYWRIASGPAGLSKEIQILPADQIEIILNNENVPKIEKYKLGRVEFPPEEIIHFVYRYDPEKVYSYGQSPLASIINEYNLSGWLKANLNDRAQTKQGSGVYLRLPKEINYSEEQLNQIKQAYSQYRTGRIKATELMILNEGELVAMPMADKDLPYDSNLRFLMERICNAFGVPISIFTESSTRAVQGVQATQFYSNCITPLLQAQAEALNRFYLPKFKNTENMFFAFDNVVPEDERLNADIYSRYVANGIMTINEVRYELNKPSIEGGDMLLIPSNLVPIGMATPEKQIKTLIEELKKIDDPDNI